MKRLLFADFYRLTKSKGPLILLIASFGFMLLTGLMDGFMFGNAKWLTTQYEEIFGFNPFPETAEMIGYEMNNLGDFVSFGLSGTLNAFLVLFIMIFIVPMRRSGFIKNIASEFKRSSFFFTQSIIIMLYAFLVTFGAASAMILTSFIFFRNFPVGNPLHILIHIFVTALLNTAVGIVVLTLTDLMKKQISAVILSLVYIMVISPMLITIGSIGSTYSSSPFRIAYISLMGNISLLTVGKWMTVLSAIFVIVCYVGLCVVLELTVVKKKDFL
ncbi:MAG: hypothetical protein IKR59_01525 [Lachnospiraceae bacterium]|nr:hypothetical protein [Lachnospiraceae bacterium]